MTVHEIATESELAGILETADTVIIDFWSPVCPPCKAFAPVFEEAAGRNPEVAFCKVNTREDEELSGAFEVEHIPTLVVIRDRILVASQPGYLQGEVLDDLIGQVAALDMDSLKEGGTAPTHTQEDEG
jgi:thioredoxin-like negative regulator of GroEL